VRTAPALLAAILSSTPLVSAAAQDERSARSAFLEVSLAGDPARMKALMTALVTSMRGDTFTADQFIELIEGCPQSFVGKALISWKCEDDQPRVVTVVLSDGPERVSLSGLAVIRIWPAPGPRSGEE
jgi:hypothetical protein